MVFSVIGDSLVDYISSRFLQLLEFYAKRNLLASNSQMIAPYGIFHYEDLTLV